MYNNFEIGLNHICNLMYNILVMWNNFIEF